MGGGGGGGEDGQGGEGGEGGGWGGGRVGGFFRTPPGYTEGTVGRGGVKKGRRRVHGRG